MATGTHLGGYPNHDGDGSGLSFSVDGKWLVTGSLWYRMVRVHDVAKKKAVADLVKTRRGGGPGGVRRVAFSPDGQLLAAIVDDQLRFWEVGTWAAKEAPVFPAAVTFFAFAPDGKSLAVRLADDTLHV